MRMYVVTTADNIEHNVAARDPEDAKAIVRERDRSLGVIRCVPLPPRIGGGLVSTPEKGRDR